MFDLLKQMVDVYGASGHEEFVAAAVEKLLKGKVDSFHRDALGNLICEKKGTSATGKKIMLSAHMDHIGFVVVSVEKEGFLRVMPVGGINLQVSKTRHVSFGNGVQGVVSQQPVREGESPAMKHMYIDIGAADDQEALAMVDIGDVAVYANDCFRLGKHRVAAPAMDDRAACALLVAVMQELPPCKNTIFAVFSTQEEVGCRGAKTAAYAIEPDVGIALDVTLNGDTPEQKQPAVMLGEGVAVKVMDLGSISHPGVVQALLAAGKDAKVKTQREVLPFGGTDAGAIQVSRGGVPVGTLSIPCRYVHSACEMVDLRDMEAAKTLLLHYLQQA